MALDFTYIVFYKPYDVLAQFTKERYEHVTLSNYLHIETDIYPVGRLDKDSEGLLILTNDKFLNQALLHPSSKKEKTYFVQVDGDIQPKDVELLSKGLNINIDGKIYHTLPCLAKKLKKEPILPERNPPIRVRKLIPTSWIMITLEEGKNRQIRRMCAKINYPVLRLVRVQMGEIKLGSLLPGQNRRLKQEEMYQLLNINMTAIKKDKAAQKKALKQEKKPSTPTFLQKKQVTKKRKK
ncbi:MAG: pseudouridine synthase [Saprospiraceae bacterium]